MATAIPEVTTEVLHAFADAWNRHDVDAIMSFMTDDCVFEASAGPDVCGARHEGQEAVRAAYADVWATFPDAHWGNARHLVQGARGVSEWTFTGTRVDGSRVEAPGSIQTKLDRPLCRPHEMMQVCPIHFRRTRAEGPILDCARSLTNDTSFRN